MSNNRYILQFRRNNGYAESRDKAVELIKSELPKCKEGEAVLCKWKDSEKDGVLMGVSNGDGSYKYMDVDETTSTAIPLKMAEESVYYNLLGTPSSSETTGEGGGGELSEVYQGSGITFGMNASYPDMYWKCYYNNDGSKTTGITSESSYINISPQSMNDDGTIKYGHGIFCRYENNLETYASCGGTDTHNSIFGYHVGTQYYPNDPNDAPSTHPCFGWLLSGSTYSNTPDNSFSGLITSHISDNTIGIQVEDQYGDKIFIGQDSSKMFPHINIADQCIGFLRFNLI